MRILFNTPNADLKGGPPTHLPWLEQELRRHVQVYNFCYGRQTDVENTAQKLYGRASNLLSLRRMLLSVKPDLIHHNSSFDPRAILRDAPLAYVAKRLGVPLFIKFHGSLPEAFDTRSPILKALRRSLLDNCSGIGVLSEAEKQDFHHSFPSTLGKVHVVKNIIKPDFLGVERRESDVPFVLFISRCIRRKGVFDFVNAIPLILSAVPSAKFLIVGDGEEAGEVDRMISNLHLEHCTERRPHCSNLETRDHYASAQVLLFPTTFPEGMPMVVAEAMAAGVPIVTTRTRFSRSYMREGDHCLFVDQHDHRDCAEKVIVLLQDAMLRRSMSTRNRQLARNFLADSVTREFLDIYAALTGIRTAQPKRLSVREDVEQKQVYV